MKKDAAEIFDFVLKDKANPKIKLLGDSITHGAGGAGWEPNGRVIVDGWAESPNGHSWANLLRDYMQEKYAATVVNNGCTGTDVDFVINNFSALVDSDDDIIVCAIGTNNRHASSERERPLKEDFLQRFYEKIKIMYGLFRDTGIPTVFIANIPATEQNEQDGQGFWRVLHMSDINNSYKKLAQEYGACVLSLYDLFSDYCKKNNLTVDEVTDGLHPNDAGHQVVFELLVKAFGV